MLDDGGDVEGIVVVKEVYQGWVNSRWGSESVGHFWYFEGVSCIVLKSKQWARCVDAEGSGAMNLIYICTTTSRSPLGVVDVRTSQASSFISKEQGGAFPIQSDLPDYMHILISYMGT